MSVSPPDLESEWRGLEPEQPRISRAAFWLGLIAAMFLSAGIIALIAYLLQ